MDPQGLLSAIVALATVLGTGYGARWVGRRDLAKVSADLEVARAEQKTGVAALVEASIAAQLARLDAEITRLNTGMAALRAELEAAETDADDERRRRHEAERALARVEQRAERAEQAARGLAERVRVLEAQITGPA